MMPDSCCALRWEEIARGGLKEVQNRGVLEGWGVGEINDCLGAW